MTRVSTRCESFGNYKKPSDFSRQYTNVYYNRLQQMRDFIVPPKGWTSKAKLAERVLDVEQGQLCWIVGTITRESGGKPNILDDLKKVYHGQAPQHSLKYCTPQDKIYLEDEHGRIELIGELLKKKLFVTGTVVGLLGKQNQVGEFEVVEEAYPQLPDPTPRSTQQKQNSGQSGKVALISGLLLDDKEDESPGVQLLFEYLAGAADVSRLIICGNSLHASPETLQGSRMMRKETSLSNLQNFDSLVSALATLLPVHVMPGESDPANIAFPQMPIHPALFQNSRALLGTYAVTLETNPQSFNIEGVSLLGTSGQPVKDLARYTEEDSHELELDLLYKTLQWRHIAPTAPDTLCSYPYLDEDPLVIMERPHVYFTGNSSSFNTTVKDDVRLICVPQFKDSGSLVLLDIETLEVEVVDLGM